MSSNRLMDAMRYLLAVSLLIATMVTPLSHSGRAAVAPTTGTGINTGEGKGEAHLVFVGDVMLGRYVGAAMQRDGYDAPFAGVRSLLGSADLAIGNLEGPLVPSSVTLPTPSAHQPLLTGSDHAAPALRRAGFDMLSLANNHSLDAGAAGLQSSVKALRLASLMPLGLADTRGTQSPVIRDVHGLKIAFLAYTAIKPNALLSQNPHSLIGPLGISYVDPSNAVDMARFRQEIASARLHADAVVVVMHWGTEYATQPDAGQTALSGLATEAGADLVVGAHPHVAQGLSTQQQSSGARTTVIAYSLGNALFDQVSSDQTRRGLALDCRIDAHGVRSARLVPLEIGVGGQGAGYRMQVEDAAQGQPTLARAALSTPATLQWRAVWDATQPQPGVALAYRREENPSERESLEELGLGTPTRISLHGGTLRVEAMQAGGAWKAVWTSDPGWRVTGYTVGDANADGKPDLVYSLWKRRLTWERPAAGGLSVNMQGGDVLPHIYINSWRDGAMRPLWHGSPRPAPALALAVAPVGLSGRPALAVLESANPQQEQAPSQAPGHLRLWDWSGGFGYELISETPGSYSQMWSDGRVLLFR